jgi:hypothetical protein
VKKREDSKASIVKTDETVWQASLLCVVSIRGVKGSDHTQCQASAMLWMPAPCCMLARSATSLNPASTGKITTLASAPHPQKHKYPGIPPPSPTPSSPG